MDATNTTTPKDRKAKAARAAQQGAHQQEQSAPIGSSTAETAVSRFNTDETRLMIESFVLFYLSHSRHSLIFAYTMAVEKLAFFRIHNQHLASESFPTLDEFYSVVQPYFSDAQVMAARYGQDDFLHFPKRDIPPEPCPICELLALVAEGETLTCDSCGATVS